jgi:DNA-directed RNA polymerase subunit beta'
MTTDTPLTGPNAIAHALRRLDLDKLEAEQKEIIKRKLKSKRPRAIKILNTIEGMRRNKMKPSEFMINNVPVIPAVFRPFSVVGDSFVPGDANELYKDLFELKSAYADERKALGLRGSGESRLALYDTVKALYGYGEPVKAKTRQRGVSGFLKKITGTSPKFGFVQRKLLSKPQDNVSRGTIAVDPELSLDEIGVPEEQAWTIYAPYIQRRLVRSGYSPKEAILAVRGRDKRAKYMLDQEVLERPVIYSRSPSWHKFNVVAGRPKLIAGNTIAISPLVTTGLNADFDGDAIHLHVPSQDSAVKEAWEKLMPSKMLFSARQADKVIPEPKQELILGLYTAQHRPAKKKWQFPDEKSALQAVQAGSVPMSDEIEFPGMDKMASAMSREQLLDEGSCCGNGCCNCPYTPQHERGASTVDE